MLGTYGLPNIGDQDKLCEGGISARIRCWPIRFCVCPRKNQSEVVYDTCGSGSYIEAAISLLRGLAMSS